MTDLMTIAFVTLIMLILTISFAFVSVAILLIVFDEKCRKDKKDDNNE